MPAGPARLNASCCTSPRSNPQGLRSRSGLLAWSSPKRHSLRPPSRHQVRAPRRARSLDQLRFSASALCRHQGRSLADRLQLAHRPLSCWRATRVSAYDRCAQCTLSAWPSTASVPQSSSCAVAQLRASSMSCAVSTCARPGEQFGAASWAPGLLDQGWRPTRGAPGSGGPRDYGHRQRFRHEPGMAWSSHRIRLLRVGTGGWRRRAYPSRKALGSAARISATRATRMAAAAPRPLSQRTPAWPEQQADAGKRAGSTSRRRGPRGEGLLRATTWKRK